jgi:hypothetical protein
MTLKVIEPKTSAVICPALEVTSGQKTFEAANREYKGLKLPCLHCWEELRRDGTRWLDRGLIEAIEEEFSQQTPSEYEIPQDNLEIWSGYRDVDASLIRNLVAKGFESALGINLPLEYDFATEKVVRTAVDATFRRGFFDTSTGKRRWMHFTHDTGRLKGTSQLSCHDPAGIEHQVAVGSFKLMLEDYYKTWSQIETVPEKTIVCKPGEPPEKRRPDLSVYKNKSEILRVLEIQRSLINFLSLQERTANLREICEQVEWYFSRGVYSRASMHESRRWLTESGIDYFYYWYDDKTGKLVYSPGELPKVKYSSLGQSKSGQEQDSKSYECRHFDRSEDSYTSWQRPPDKLTASFLGAAVHQNNGTEKGKNYKDIVDNELHRQIQKLSREVNILLGSSGISWDAFLKLGSQYPKEVKQIFWDALSNEEKWRIQGYRDDSSF